MSCSDIALSGSKKIWVQFEQRNKIIISKQAICRKVIIVSRYIYIDTCIIHFGCILSSVLKYRICRSPCIHPMMCVHTKTSSWNQYELYHIQETITVITSHVYMSTRHSVPTFLQSQLGNYVVIES